MLNIKLYVSNAIIYEHDHKHIKMEEEKMIMFNRANRVPGVAHLTKGGLNGSIIDTRVHSSMHEQVHDGFSENTNPDRKTGRVDFVVGTVGLLNRYCGFVILDGGRDINKINPRLRLVLLHTAVLKQA